jgi:hypothetical protein
MECSCGKWSVVSAKWSVVSGQWSMISGQLNSQAVTWDLEQIPEESARVGRTWRILMLEECRLRLVGNSASGRRGGLCGRRRGGVVAPLTMRGSIVLIVTDRPAAAHGTIVRRCLNVSNPRMIWAIALVELRVGCSFPAAMGSTRRRNGAKQSQL